MRKHVVAVALFIAVAGAFAVPQFGSSAHAATRAQSAHVQAHPQLFDRTRFVLHMAVAIGVFHHWVWKPYKAGAFKDWQHHKLTLVKAGAALLLTVHEVKTAYGIAKSSNVKSLQAIAGVVEKIQTAFTNIGNKLKSGQFNPTDVTSANGEVNSVLSKVGFSAP